MRGRIILVLFIVLGWSVSNSFAQDLEFTFTTTKENIVASRALIDKPELTGNPHAIIIATPLGDSERLNPHAIGAWYYQEKWHIFNTDHASMPAKLQFKLQVFLAPGFNQWVHRISDTNRLGSGSYLNHSEINFVPTAQIKILQNHRADGNYLNPKKTHLVYNQASGRWVIENVDGSQLLMASAYNVVIQPPVTPPVKLPGAVTSNTKTPGTDPVLPTFDPQGNPYPTSGGNGVNHNTFAGIGAGQANTTGSTNSFFGTDAGSSNKSGNQNTFVGWNTGSSNTSGQRNSFFGAGAGGSNATGSDNTMIGAGAGAYTPGLKYATALGADATVYTSNTVVLGRPEDTVLIPGLGVGGSGHLCRNNLLQISLCSSSLRYKTNIMTFRPGLSLIHQLRPIAFDWKAGGMKDVGFGAEDVARIDPLFVTYNAAGEIEGVKYDRLSAVFVNAFKEQQAQIDAQAKQLAEQQRLIDALRELICSGNSSAAVCKVEKK